MTVTDFRFPKPNGRALWEVFCLALFERMYNLRSLQRYRNNGDAQHGVDILGTTPQGEFVAIQCKIKNEGTCLTVNEAERDLGSAIEWKVPIRTFYFATTFSRRHLQDWAIQRNQKLRDSSVKEVVVLSWPDFEDVLNLHEDLRLQLYGQLLASQCRVDPLCNQLVLQGAEQWRMDRLLGRGGYGSVWRGVSAHTNEFRVFKILENGSALRSLQLEVIASTKLLHRLGRRPDIQYVIASRLDKYPKYLELEYAPYGSLLEWIIGAGGLGRIEVKSKLEILARVSELLHTVHCAEVSHNDVKPSNFLVRDQSGDLPSLRIADFGISSLGDPMQYQYAGYLQGLTDFPFTHNPLNALGSMLYHDPTSQPRHAPDYYRDIYALGVMIIQFMSSDLTASAVEGWSELLPDERLQQCVRACIRQPRESRLNSLDELANRLRRIARSTVRTTSIGVRHIYDHATPVEYNLYSDLIDKNILLLESDIGYRDEFYRVLCNAGAKVTALGRWSEFDQVVVDESAGIEGNGEEYAVPSLAIVDIALEDATGYEVFARLRKMYPKTSIVLTTGFGYDPEHSIVRASMEGLQHVLFKPVRPLKLLEQCVRALRTV